MVNSIKFFLLFSLLLVFAPFCQYDTKVGDFLYPQFYDGSCPRVEEIVKSVVSKAVAKEPRMAASLLRLHFHDCFVKGCDASVLLDSSGTIISEKRSNPNRNSARGFEVIEEIKSFEVIEEIKSAVEKECPHTVSCADILTLAARDSTVLTGGPNWDVPLGRRDSLGDSTVLTGGPNWDVPLGRRDSLGASISGSNNNIPAPNNTFQTILTKFKLKGLNIVDLVALSALSGSHTIGDSRCTSFRQRLYNQTGNGKSDFTLDQNYAAQLHAQCPRSGGDQNLFVLDFVTPVKFDNNYYKNLLANKGLLSSDEVLLTKNQVSADLVKTYAARNDIFFEQFAKSMVKLGNITPLTGSRGEIRKHCRKINK